MTGCPVLVAFFATRAGILYWVSTDTLCLMEATDATKPDHSL